MAPFPTKQAAKPTKNKFKMPLIWVIPLVSQTGRNGLGTRVRLLLIGGAPYTRDRPRDVPVVNTRAMSLRRRVLRISRWL